jgi:GT2 family glycosyltransferase
MTDRDATVGVVIPASDWAKCPINQARSVTRQLTERDQLIVVLGSGLREEYHTSELEQLGADIVVMDDPTNAADTRNTGATALAPDIEHILFCDADDTVAEAWVTALSSALQSEIANLVGGVLNLRNQKCVDDPFAPDVDFGFRQSVFGGNMGLTREAWTTLGGFDKTLDYGEDMDIAWRAPEHGFTVSVVPDAIVHCSLESLVPELAQRFRWGQWSVKILRKYGLTAKHLPSLRGLYTHKRDSGFANCPLTAAVAQWVGQTYERYAGSTTHTV